MREDKPRVTGDHRTGSALTDQSTGLWHLSRVLIPEPLTAPGRVSWGTRTHVLAGAAGNRARENM